jgi:hypothetical protein
MSSTDIASIREFVAHGDLRAAIDRLRSNLEKDAPALLNDVVILSARLEDVRGRTRRGTVTEGSADAIRSQIAAAILDLADEAARVGDVALRLAPLMNVKPPFAASEDELNSHVHTKSPQPVSLSAHTELTIFLASSNELKDDRDAFELYFRQQNDRLRHRDVYLTVVRWENFLDAMSDGRLQEEYNAQVRACDIFVSLFKTKAGRFTGEEFDVAFEQFKKTGRPRIYTYFREGVVSLSQANRQDLTSLWDFKDRLTSLGHFFTTYESEEHLKRHFRDQLDMLIDAWRV